MLKRLKEKGKKGYVTILILLIASIAIPFIMLWLVEMPYLYDMRDKFQGYSDFAAEAAVMQLDEDALHAGQLSINQQKANDIVRQTIARNYRLNDDLSVNNDSILKSKPKVKVYFVPHDMEQPEEYVTDEGYKFTINHPTVIVYTELNPRGIFSNTLLNMKTLSAYEVFFKQGDPLSLPTTTPQATDGLTFSVTQNVNPLHEVIDDHAYPIIWKFDPLNLALGGEIQIGVHSDDPSVSFNAVHYQLHITSDGYDQTIDREMTKDSADYVYDDFVLPDDIPIGANVSIDFGNKGIDLSTEKGTKFEGNKAVGFKPNGSVIGTIETNLNQLVKFQKVYTNE